MYCKRREDVAIENGADAHVIMWHQLSVKNTNRNKVAIWKWGQAGKHFILLVLHTRAESCGQPAEHHFEFCYFISTHVWSHIYILFLYHWNQCPPMLIINKSTWADLEWEHGKKDSIPCKYFKQSDSDLLSL